MSKPTSIDNTASDLARGMAVATPPEDPAPAIERARQVLQTVDKPRVIEPYPVDSLGPTLAAACKGIAQAGQIQPAMVGQTLLATASLLTQALFNVETLAGWSPISLYLITLGDSGQRKSTAQAVALWPVTEWQRRATRKYARELAEFAKLQKLQRTSSKSAKIEDTAEPQQPPIYPSRVVADATVEGLRRDLSKGQPSQGLFTDEAVTILAGYGMSAEHRAKTAGTFNKIWDSGYISSSRGSEGRTERDGCRLAMHWLVQPQAAAEAINDPLLLHLGLWARFLAAWPEPLPPCKALPFRPELLPTVRAYWVRCKELLDIPLPEDADDSPMLPLSNAAHKRLAGAFEQFEVRARTGDMQRIAPFMLRASEQACRVAGVIAAFEGQAVVSDTTMAGALELVFYSLQTWRALIEDNAAEQSTEPALRLFEWLTKRKGWSESLAVILRHGPRCVRSKDSRDSALALLQVRGLADAIEATNDRRVTIRYESLP